jgi:signal peptidase I, bacterial type
VRRWLISRQIRALGRVSSLVMVFSCGMLMFGTRGFLVYGSCMEPGLHTGERVLASKFSYFMTTPHRGDVVIFRYPCDPSKNYVKRVIGLPGDLVEIREGDLFVNGEQMNEPYKLNAAHGDYGPERVKSGNLFVLGDNRDQSNDSRYWGELPMNLVVAKAVMLYWPLNRVRLLN